jgi:hypothetical protein
VCTIPWHRLIEDALGSRRGAETPPPILSGMKLGDTHTHTHITLSIDLAIAFLAFCYKTCNVLDRVHRIPSPMLERRKK